MGPDTLHNAFSHPGSFEEKYSRTFIVSISIHVAVFLLVIFGQYLYPRKVIQIGTGLGGGTGGDISTVGVIDELSGGAGMFKPSITPKPPALEEKPVENKSKAIPLPDTVDRKKKTIPQTKTSPKAKPAANIIPTEPEPGSGGTGGRSGGSGGGAGGGIGVSIGAGSGGLGDNMYARTVERRISENWARPPEGVRVNIIYSFYIDAYGRIRGIQKEKSSGNPELDFMAERAIRSVIDLPAPPPEFEGQLIQFSVHFVYPPDQ
jgi:TonB family protein